MREYSRVCGEYKGNFKVCLNHHHNIILITSVPDFLLLVYTWLFFLVQDIYFQIWKYHYCNKVIWNCIIISHWKLLHSNIHMLGFAKRYRTLSSISTISLCFLAWLNYSFFQIFKILSFFRYRRITFSRLDLKRICISQNKRLLKFVMFSLNKHVAPKLLSFL